MKTNTTIKMSEIDNGNNLQRGMYFDKGIILINTQPDAQYPDVIEGDIVISIGHNVRTTKSVPTPESVNQSKINQNGTPNENGKFYNYAKEPTKTDKTIKIYEKIATNEWQYLGAYNIVDAWTENYVRKVFKFKFIRV